MRGCKPYLVELPFLCVPDSKRKRRLRPGEWEYVAVPCILPWHVVMGVGGAGEKVFERVFTSDGTHSCNPLAFWTAAFEEEWGRLHPAHVLTQEQLMKAVPVCWLMDDMQISKGSGGPVKFSLYSWASSLTAGCSKWSKHLCFAIPTNRCLAPSCSNR